MRNRRSGSLSFSCREIGDFYYGTCKGPKPIIFLPIDKFAKYNPPTSPMYCREELSPRNARKMGPPDVMNVLRRKANRRLSPCVRVQLGGSRMAVTINSGFGV